MNQKRAKQLRKLHNASNVLYIHGAPPVYYVNEQTFSVTKVKAGVPTTLDPLCGRAAYQAAKLG